MSRKSICDPSRLEAILLEHATADDERWAEAHLENCPDCRQRIDQSAAEPESWEQAAAFLRDEPFDAEPVSTCGDSLDHEAGQLVGSETQRVLELLAPTDDPRMLGRLGTYEISGVVGSGGMGVVLKGFDPALNRYVAIKVLTPRLASTGAARMRFAREAQAAAAVVHPHVIGIHAVSADGNLPFFVMPYVPGMSLQRRIDQHGPLSVVEVLRIASQTAAGLAAAHAQGLVHRDIKPANILLEQGVERVTITDFGLARAVDDATLTCTGIIAGTPQYMSPEQARGEAVEATSDLFSLGSVIYAMCTGRPPFRADRALSILNRICNDRHRPVWQVNPEVPDDLSDLIDQLLEKNPKRRFRDAQQVEQRLTRILARVQEFGGQRRGGLRRILRRHRRTWMSLALAGCVLLATAAALVNVDPAPGLESGNVPPPSVPSETPAPLLIESAPDRDVVSRMESRLQELETSADSARYLHAESDDWRSEIDEINSLLDAQGAPASSLSTPRGEDR